MDTGPSRDSRRSLYTAGRPSGRSVSILLNMRVIPLFLAVLAMICVAATSTLARESHRSSSSKSRTSKHSKAGRSKASTAQRKSSVAKKAATARKTSRLRSTGDIDVSAGAGQDLPPEELPVSEADDANDTDDESTVTPTP